MTIALLTLTLATLTATAAAQSGPLPTPPATSVSMSEGAPPPVPRALGPRYSATDRLELEGARARAENGSATLAIGVVSIVLGGVGGVGTVIALLVDALGSVGSCLTGSCSSGPDDGLYIGLGAASGALLALGLGLTIGGSIVRSQAATRQQEIEARALRMSLAPARGGAALAVALSF